MNCSILNLSGWSRRLHSAGAKRARFLIGSAFAVFYAGQCLSSAAPKVVLNYDKESGTAKVQIQGLKEGDSSPRVNFVDLVSRETVGSLSQFSETPLRHVKEGSWQVPSGSRLVAAVLASPEKSTLDAPVEFPYGTITFNGEFAIVNASLEFDTDEFRWSLGRGAFVRPIVATRSGLPLARPFGWRVAPAGRSSEQWDFRGDDGYDYSGNAFLRAYLQSIPLPSNWIACGEVDLAKVADIPEFTSLELPDRELDFTLEFRNPDGNEIEENGPIPYVPGMVLVVKLTEESLRFVSGKRFEILVYFEGEFVHEESQGVSPFFYILPPNLNGRGIQTLSINVLEYGGNWGTRSVKINFE